MTAELLALAAEIETLEGPSREMDARMAVALRPELQLRGGEDP